MEASQHASQGKAERQLSILIVDDDRMVSQLLAMFLGDIGHKVETAADGAEGLAKFHSGRHDVVITDNQMPHMLGRDMAVAIKQLSPETPIIMMKGDRYSEDPPPRGVDYLLDKPLPLKTLWSVVKQATTRE